MKKILLFFVIFLFAIPKVSAVNEAPLVKERIEDTYTYYYDTNLERNRYLYANRVFLNSNIVYCLELGKEISSTMYTYSSSFDELNLDDNTLEKIKLLSYYGYDYPGHNTEKYYMATQELIWRALSSPNITWVLELNSSKVVDVSKEKNEIINLVNTHYQKPSFDNKETDFILGEELVLTDTNNILNRYVSSDENIVIEGNKLIIKENFDKEEIILSKPSYTKNNFFLYTSGTSQKMMSTGKPKDVTARIKVNQIKGSFELIKLDKETGDSPQGEGTLKGAVYEVYDSSDTLVDTIITGENNKIDKLPVGKYSLKEKIPSKGYLLDETIYNFEITKDNLNIKINVYEEVIKRKVELFKVFASNTTGELTGEPNITFEIYDNKNVKLTDITTDQKGYANITLPYGTYTFKQINTTPNYYKVEPFKITIDNYDERPIHKILSDSEIRAKLKIIKKDLDTKHNILNSNIKFKIFDVNNNKYLSLKVSYPENKVTSEFQIDKNGIFITPISLPPGTYIIEEIQEKMNGYLYNNKKITFKIDENTEFIKEDNELLLEVPFYNKIVRGNISITKYGEEIEYINNSYQYKKVPLENVILNLYAKENIYENNKLIYEKDSIVKELTTNKEGKTKIDDLPLGKYYLKEISTVNNHILDDKIYDITLSYIDEITPIVNEEIEINNYLPKGTLTIKKYETNTNIQIPNTLIEVRTKDNKVVYKGYTDINGTIILKDLPYGEYYLSEEEASTGYKLLEDKISFDITSDNKEINIYNDRIKVPNTGLSLNNIDIFIIISIIITIIILILFHKEKSIVLLSIVLILLSTTYFTIKIYKYYEDYQNNKESVNAYINNEIEIIKEEKYQYSRVLEIPALNIKRGILDINNEYNDAKYNIELIKEDENMIILAAHNGKRPNSYFGTLNNIELGDKIKYYKDNIVYEYIYSDSYDIKKNGYADIYSKRDQKSIVLITCKDNDEEAQTVYIGYLKETNTF